MVISTDRSVAQVFNTDAQNRTISGRGTGGIKLADPEQGIIHVHSEADMKDDALVNIGGFQLKVSEAREYGLLPALVNAAEGGDNEAGGFKAQDIDETESDSTLLESPDAAVQTTDAALTTLEFQAGIRAEDAPEFVLDVLDGNLDQAATDALTERGLTPETLNTEIAQASDEHYATMQRELGDEAAQWFAQAAQFDDSIKKLAIIHAIRRGRGSRVSWRTVYDESVKLYNKKYSGR